MITCILLSAGSSTRFGSPKALATFRGVPIIEHLQKQLLNTKIDEIIVVLGAHVDKIKPLILNHKRIKVVYNKDYNFGQTSSFKIGLNNVNPNATGILLFPIDFPLIKPTTVDQLIDLFTKDKPRILIPTFNDRKGHPPVFHISLKQDFLGLDYTGGVNSIFHQHEDETKFVPVKDAGVIKTFNTKEELESILVQEII